MRKELNTFGYELRVIINKVWFKFPKTFKLNDKEYYLINGSQFQTRKEIEKCKTKEMFEDWIKTLKQVKNAD